jgi:hypothetical protein
MNSTGKILLHDAIDLTAHRPWAKEGFIIEQLFSEDEYSTFQSQTRTLLLACWRKAGFLVNDNFLPEDYHTLAPDFETHVKAIEHTKLLQTSQFPGGIQRVEKRISEIVATPVHVFNPWDQASVFHFRVIRPFSHDNNPLHRDVWLEDYADCINLYIPVAGSNEQSSLTLIPGSHHWPENTIERTEAGATVEGIRFNVPAVTAVYPEHNILRPNPQLNEVLVFSPYLLHGGATNLNANTTRISIEVRLWKR